MRNFLRVAAKLAPAAVVFALCSSAQAATYAWGVTKSIDPSDASFALAQGESHTVDYNLLVVNALASGNPENGSETATVTDEIACPAGFTCARTGTTSFPLTVAAADGSFKNISDSFLVTNNSACGRPVTLTNTATVTPNGGAGLAESDTTDATISLPPCSEEEPPTISGPGDITVDATSAEGAPVSFAVTATGGTPSCENGDGEAVASGDIFPIGATTVTCVVTNGAGSASTSFVITVRDLPAQLDDLLGLGLPHSLEVKLAHAGDLLAAGDIATACNVLNAFQQEARSQTGHQLAPTLAAQVLPAVQRIGELAGC
jgi:hypothetical protein